MYNHRLRWQDKRNCSPSYKQSGMTSYAALSDTVPLSTGDQPPGKNLSRCQFFQRLILMMTLETWMEWWSNSQNELQHTRHKTEFSLNLLVRTELIHLLILSMYLRWHAPLLFKINKPGIQAARILCLCKILVNSPFCESQTVHCP